MVTSQRTQGLVKAARGGKTPLKGGRTAAGASVGPHRSVAAEDGWLSCLLLLLPKQLHLSPDPHLKSLQIACIHSMPKGTMQAFSPPQKHPLLSMVPSRSLPFRPS